MFIVLAEKKIVLSVMFVVGRKTKSFGGQNVCTFQETFFWEWKKYPSLLTGNGCHSEDRKVICAFKGCLRNFQKYYLSHFGEKSLLFWMEFRNLSNII